MRERLQLQRRQQRQASARRVGLVSALLLLASTSTTTTGYVFPTGHKSLAVRPCKQQQPLEHRSLFASIQKQSSDSTTDDQQEEPLLQLVSTPSSSSSSPLNDTTPPKSASKLRRLKDIMWVREALEDVTAAEFACTVEADHHAQDQRAKRKRAVDYEKLLTQLNKRLRDMGCGASSSAAAATAAATTGPTQEDNVTCVLTSGVGMGSIYYNDVQRQTLMERILRARQLLMDVIKGYELEIEPVSFSIQLPRMELPKESDDSNASPGPKLYVRDDGTVDWDGALQDQAALRKFGTAVWARINGRDPESLDDENNGDTQTSNGAVATAEPQKEESPSHKPVPITARIEETAEIKQARAKLNVLSKELNELESEHLKLLNSAITAGQAVANVRLATLEPALRNQIRVSATAIEKKKEQVSFQTLVYELERIYTYLVGELGNPALNGYIPLQDRLNVAEFGLLESQIDSFSNQMEAGESVDADVLAVVMEQLTDFKRRLGIDYYVTGVSFDGETIRRFVADLAEKTKKGLAFYVKGVQLFWNDILFCLRLINRAAQGYTLKPREVRTLRRTFKDIITFIPFVIILLIPLSPVGHVLVFGAIQRFFPDFFPSCFTEQRQNLLQLYENAEYSEVTINETFKEKVARLSEAFLYFVANISRAIYIKLVALVNASNTGTSSESSEPNNTQK